MLDLVKRYSGNIDVIRARAAVRPIIRRSQPVAGPIPGLDGQFIFSGWAARGDHFPLVRRPACRTSRVRNGSAAGSAACPRNIYLACPFGPDPALRGAYSEYK